MTANNIKTYFSILILFFASCSKKKADTVDDIAGAPSSLAYIIEVSTSTPAAVLLKDSRHFYGICWRGSNASNLAAAKALGFGYIFYDSGMEKESLATNLKFIIESPETNLYSALFGDWRLQRNQVYSDANKNALNKYFAWKQSGVSFPDNLASGWFFSHDEFRPMPDFQQQVVIDYFVDAIMTYIKSKEKSFQDFTFGGLAWDVPQLTGDFYDKPSSEGGKQITLAYWTGSDSSVLHEGITHEYATYSDGMAAYYKQLKSKILLEYPNAIFIVEPYRPYDDWIAHIENRSDFDELMKNVFISQEKYGSQMIDDSRVHSSGKLLLNKMGSSTPEKHDELSIRTLASKLAISGSWFNWFGRFGGSGDGYDYQDANEVTAYQHLERVIPGWDNLASVPLTERAWTNGIYSSTNSYMSESIVYSRHPGNKKIYALFLSNTGVIKLRPEETVIRIQKADAIFQETSIDGSTDLTVIDGEIRLRN